jgi:hypothetical protein
LSRLPPLCCRSPPWTSSDPQPSATQSTPQALQPAVSLRAHIHSLSRRVLLGAGHYDGLPVDLFLGGLSSELAALLKGSAPADAAAAAAAGGGGGGQALAVAASTLGALPWGAPPAHVGALPQSVADFFSVTLPLPQLAILVFAEFVPVDPLPPAPLAPPARAGAGALAPPHQAAPNGGRSYPHYYQPAEAAQAPGSPAGSIGSGASSAARTPRKTESGNGDGGRLLAPASPAGYQQQAPVSFAAAAAAAAAAVKAVAADLGNRPGQRGRGARRSG